MVIVNQISYSAKRSELKKVDFLARSITFCEKTRREKTSYLQISRNSFDNFYKSWCHGCKNNRFWVLISLLSRKINILWTPKKDFEAPIKNELTITVECYVKISFNWWVMIWPILQKLKLWPQKLTFLSCDFFSESKICYSNTT